MDAADIPQLKFRQAHKIPKIRLAEMLKKLKRSLAQWLGMSLQKEPLGFRLHTAFCQKPLPNHGKRGKAMDKIRIGQNFFIPMPVVLVGTLVSGKANFMAVGWCSRANASPPMIVCGIGKQHYTHKGITETETFSVNIPSSDLLEKTDYCGMVSGKNADKSGVFDLFYGSLKTAPMIRECPVTLECRLVQTVSLPTNTLFIGEIAGAYADGRAMKDGRPDCLQIDPLLLTMPDNRYWRLGEYSGDAWSAGKNLMQSKEATRKDGN
jgi:flavin reductase (DIM6/NTAB) family NADH-FMN oxidoreductase RutF